MILKKMNFKCKTCGGKCLLTSTGEYQCESCGSVYPYEENNSFFSRPSVVENDSGVNVFEKNINGILEIECTDKNEVWAGSGYLVSKNGLAITNAHVVANSTDGRPYQNIMVKLCNQRIPAIVVALGDDRAGNGKGVDLALIQLAKIPMNATPLSFENFDRVRNGEKVYVIGNSLGDGTCITSGIVSDKNRVLNGKKVLMTDCAINGGNSGGPIFNVQGKVIGTICSERIKRDGTATKGMNYAVPADIVRFFIDETLRKTKKFI